MFSDVATAEINPPRRILNRESLVNCTRVTAPISNIQHDACRQASSVQTKHAGWVEEELGDLEVLEKHLSRADPISNRVVRWLSQEYWVFPGVHLEFFKDMSPDCFHVIPILHNTVIHGVAQLEDALEFFLQRRER